MAIEKTSFEPGETIADRYEVESILGQGGMGVVYLVQDNLTSQRLALKTLLPQYIDRDRVVHRFVREVKTLRRLNHPSIVRIYDAQRYGSLLFYTMDYIDGRSLRDWIRRRGRLKLGSTVRVLALVAHALEYAHQYTIHRDISPDNIMVLPDGSVRLLDFGLAKLLDSEAKFTMVGVTLGKKQYNSPEMLASAAEVDHRADIYSLGVIFHEMLSGTLPQTSVKLSELVPELPKECDEFVAKATAHLREDRFANAREFRTALMKLYEHAHTQQHDFAVQAATPAPGPYSTPTPQPTPTSASNHGVQPIWQKLRAWFQAVFSHREH